MQAVLSFSHKNLSIDLREKIALPQEEVEDFYRALLAEFALIDECILLSTCNRFELLLFTSLGDLSPIVAFIASYRNLDLSLIAESAQMFYAQDAIRHIFAVASSLDSLIIGETQITGQLKDAYKRACDLGFCKKELSSVMHFALKTSALIRSQTQISKNPTSNP